MSCNYANGLKPYEHKGILGIPEKFDDENTINEKCGKLAQLILSSKHVVFHTGAGISTSAGIPDFRGPNGVWTLERKGEKPNINISFEDAIPTKTHMALKALIDAGFVKYIISQNIDGLHLKSAIDRKNISELHGNMFIEICTKCRRQYIRKSPAPTVGKRHTGNMCSRGCRNGYLHDSILDWEHDLPDSDFALAYSHSSIADLNVCLGTTLQIKPSGNLPMKNKKFNGKMVICNLQPTQYDKKADLIISTYVDTLMVKLMKRLGVEIPDYSMEIDPTKCVNDTAHLEWTIPIEHVKEFDRIYENKLKLNRKRKSIINQYDDDEADDDKKIDKKDIKKKLKKEKINLLE